MAPLRNTYWVLRHGRSIPNERGLVVSSRENGILAEFGLAPEGFDQAKVAGELFSKELVENGIPSENVRICYSPFSRTTQTAETVASVLGIPFESPQCMVMEELRERYFGPSFEHLSHDKYAEIWALDEKDPFLRPEGGESVADVVLRLTNVLTTIESELEGCMVLIVSHGDPLQILQTTFHEMAKHPISDTEEDVSSRMQRTRVHSVLSQHRTYALSTGELRRLLI